MSKYMYLYIYTYINIHIYACIYTYICLHIYVYIYIHTYVYMHTYAQFCEYHCMAAHWKEHQAVCSTDLFGRCRQVMCCQGQGVLYTTHCNTLHHTATPCNSPLMNECVCSPLIASETRSLCVYVHMTFCNTLQHTATHCNTPSCLQPIDNVLDEALAVREMRLNPDASEFAGDAAEWGQNAQETALYGDEKMLDETHSKMLRLMADLHAGRIDRILKEERELVALLVKLRHKRYRIPRPDILSGLCSVCGGMIGPYMTRSDSERHSHGQLHSRRWPCEGLFPQMIRIHTDSFAETVFTGGLTLYGIFL